MTEEEKKRVERLLSNISAAAGKDDWKTVRNLSEVVLSLDPENMSAVGFLKVSKQMLQALQRETQQASVEAQAVQDKSLEAHPHSFVDRRYMVKVFLGEGARKKAYLAHDTVLDRDVAFALIKTKGLDEDAKRRVVREAQVMGKLGAHNNLVTVYDMGKHVTYPLMNLAGYI
jgi:serine/threonine protein kinase